MNKEQALSGCYVEGNVVKLPNIQLDRKVYGDVKKALELIGGKWKAGKVQGFVFNEDPTEHLDRLKNGEVANLKKEYQFFPTPDVIADIIVDLANINKEHTILEPSAGQGAIVNAISRKLGVPKLVWCVELMEINRGFLKKIPNVHLESETDFLNFNSPNEFDRIIANPPFSKNQDIDHVYHMFKCLKSGGRLVSIMSRHWQFSNNKKERDFREWLHKGCTQIIDDAIPEAAFKESGTMTNPTVLIIDK